MSKLTSRKLLIATLAGLAVAGGGAAIAASQSDSPASSFFDSVAEHLGISSEELEDATKAAAIDQVDQALEDGRITQEQAEDLTSRIESGDFPGFLVPRLFGLGGDGGPGRPGGHHLFFGSKLAPAAEFLGLTEAELREQLQDGQSLADVAEAEGRSVEGLKQAILAGAKSDLDAAVQDDRLTQEQADAAYRRLEGSIDDIVNGTFHGRLGGFRRGFGSGGPPGFAPHGDRDDLGGGGRFGGFSGDGPGWDTAA
ncbi:MAG: hypothetical protein ACRDMU_02410 [Gaiellaceae bacterium]